ncbi:LPXTG cell wall anchor domain-containing protein [Sphingomonas sp. NSE70-1]|uniref:LPXTG cell wall anchor domain-containing protein n=1 Tax=Sphingomonas caseinilyticus TaxID=2908205 RepID=A0ABT0RSX6_9SPHN|nr:LPXTG cell wall anchor domain-containing protein [Sphingomonas caseinilyticus]MCL6698113.1 LPXTG cell wall anchor domain-containing protein [Sphingomonas caseinilyticus]
MHYEDTGAKKTQLIALLMTALLVGGAIFYVM